MEREKAKAYKRAAQKGKEAIQKEKERAQARYDELAAKNAEARKKATEGRHTTDAPAYRLGEFSQHQKENWANSKRIVLFEGVQQFRQFIRNALSGKNQTNKKLYFGTISADLAAEIKAETGIDVEGYNLSLGENEIRKINKSHGNESTEAARGQRAVTEADYLSIPDVVQSPDRISLSSKTYEEKPVIEFRQYNGNETTVVAAVVSDKRLDLFVQTTFINKKTGSIATPESVQADSFTPKATGGTAPINSISEKGGDVKADESVGALIGTALTGEKWYGVESTQMSVISDLLRTVWDTFAGVREIVTEGTNVVKNGGDLGEYLHRNGGNIRGSIKDTAEEVSAYLVGVPEGARLHLFPQGADRGSARPALAGGARLRTSATKNRRKPTSLMGCIFLLWTLPRAKNCSPALNFYTSVRTGAALSSLSRPEGKINKGIPLVYLVRLFL